MEFSDCMTSISRFRLFYNCTLPQEQRRIVANVSTISNHREHSFTVLYTDDDENCLLNKKMKFTEIRIVSIFNHF